MSSPTLHPMNASPTPQPITPPARRFPRFRVPAPRFLVSELTQVQELVILLRVRPQITIVNYTQTLLLLVFWASAVFSMACSLLELVVSGTFLLLLPVLQQSGWQLFLSLFTGTAALSPRLRLYAGVFWLLLGLFAGFLWMIGQNRRAYREWRALRRMHTMSAAERAHVSLQQFLRVSLPFWASYTLDEQPTADTLLTLLREREQATAQQTEALSADLSGEEQGEDAASVNTLLTVTHHLSFSLLGPDGRRMTMVFSHAVAPLVGFLATREPGTFVVVRELHTQVYPDGNEGSFAIHRARANQQVLSEARRAGFFAETDDEEASGEQGTSKARSQEQDEATFEQQAGEQTPSPRLADEDANEQDAGEDTRPAQENKEEAGPITLFDHEGEGQRSSWRLSHACQVEVFPFLQRFYATVVRAQAQALPAEAEMLSLQELRQGCHRLMDEYGDGFLATHMRKGYIWPWALPFYRAYQEQCLAILSYVTQRERDHLATLTTAKEKMPVIASIAQLYGWRALVATGLDLKDGGVPAEQDMERCLFYSGRARKYSAARAIYRRYVKLRARIEPTYEPGDQLSTRAQEVLASAKKMR